MHSSLLLLFQNLFSATTTIIFRPVSLNFPTNKKAAQDSQTARQLLALRIILLDVSLIQETVKRGMSLWKEYLVTYVDAVERGVKVLLP